MSGNLIPINLNSKPVVQQMPQQVTLPPLKLPDIPLQNQVPLIPINLNISPEFGQNTNIQASNPIFNPVPSLTKPNENKPSQKPGMEILGSEFKRILQDDSGSLNITRVLEIYDNIKKRLTDYISKLPFLSSKTNVNNIPLNDIQAGIQTNEPTNPPMDTKAARKQRVENLINNNYQVLPNMLGFYTFEETAIEPLKSVMDELLSDKTVSSFLFEGNPDDKKLCQRIMVYSRFVYEIEHKSKDGRKTFLSNINKALSDEILEKYSDFTLKAKDIRILHDFIDNVDILTRNPEFLEANREISHLYPSIYASLARYTEEHPEYRDLIVSDINGILAFKNNYGVNVLEAYLPIFGNLFSTQKFDFKQIAKIFEDKKMQLGQIQEVAEIFKNHKNVSGRIIINQSNNYNEETIEKYRQIAQNDKEKIYDIESIRYFDTQTVEKFKTEHPDLIKYISSGFVSLHTLLSLSEEIDLNKVKEFLEKLSKADSKNTLTYKSVNKFLGQMCKNNDGDFEWNDEETDKLLKNLTKLLKADKFNKLENLALNEKWINSGLFNLANSSEKITERIAEILSSEKLKDLSDETLFHASVYLNKNLAEKICDTMPANHADNMISNLWRNNNIRGDIKTKERFVDLLVKIYKTDTGKRFDYFKFINNNNYDIDTLELVIGNLNIDKSNTGCIMPILMALEANPEFGKKIISDEKYKLFREAENVQHIEEIIDATDKNTEELTELLCCDEKYAHFRTSKNIGNIAGIIRKVKYAIEKNPGYNIDNTKKTLDLFNDKKINTNYFFYIADKLTPENEELLLKKVPDMMMEHRDILKSGVEDLTNDDIYAFVFQDSDLIEAALKILTDAEFIHCFGLKFEGLKEFLANLYHLYDSPFREDILRIFNPENSEEGISILKQIEQLKEKNRELSKIENLDEKIIPMQENSNRIKKLKSELTKMHSPKDNLIKDGKGIKDVISVLKIACAFYHSNSEYLEKLIEILDNPEIRNKKEEINKLVNQKIFKKYNIPFDKALSDKLGLEKSEYLAELLSSEDEEFADNFSALINCISSNPNLSISEALQTLEQNKTTKKIFKKLGINYDRYITVDKNSFKKVEVSLNSDKAKQALITNLEKDFNDVLFELIPKEEKDKIFNALKEKGITLKEIQETVFDEDGFDRGVQTVLKLYKGENPIEFSEINEVITTIKEILNKEEFWTRKNNNEQVEEAKNTLYNHFLKLRNQELKNIENCGASEKNATLEIRQTDMTDLIHSLFLGNQAGCCTAVGTGCNQFSAPTYIMNRLISGIEIADGNTCVGNTMMYIAEVDGEPSLVLDNIEVKGKYQYNNSIRDAFFDYAKQFVKEIGKPDMPIYAGPYRHKLNMPEQTKKERTVKILGSTGEQEIYIDYNGHTKIDGKETFKNIFYKIQ